MLLRAKSSIDEDLAPPLARSLDNWAMFALCWLISAFCWAMLLALLVSSCDCLGMSWSVGMSWFFVEIILIPFDGRLFFLLKDVTDCDLFWGVIDLFLWDCPESWTSCRVGLDYSMLLKWTSDSRSPLSEAWFPCTMFIMGNIAAETDVCMSLSRPRPAAAEGVIIGLLFF